MNTMRRWLVASMAAVAAFAGSAALAADANVAGEWAMTVETPQGTGNPTFSLKQTGSDVTGTYKGQMGESAVTGTVTGNELKLVYKINAQGMDLEVTYTGTVEGNTMKGKVSYGGMMDGTFSGKKS